MCSHKITAIGMVALVGRGRCGGRCGTAGLRIDGGKIPLRGVGLVWVLGWERAGRSSLRPPMPYTTRPAPIRAPCNVIPLLCQLKYYKGVD